jgi:anti-sigma B factor antagonist
MSFSIFHFDSGVARVVIAGDLDVATLSILRRELSNVLRQHPARVEMDLSGLDVIDTSGVKLLISFFKSLDTQGGLLKVCGPRDQRLAIKLPRLRGLLGEPDPVN